MVKELYSALVEATVKEEAFIQSFWAGGSHIGEAIDSILEFTKHIGMESPLILEIDPFDINDLPDYTIRSSQQNIYYVDSRNYFPVEECTAFQLPYGIVSSGVEGDFELDDIKEGYTLYKDTDIKSLEVVVDKSKLLDIFTEVLEILPSIRVLWVKIAGDWEQESGTEIYANEQLNTISLAKDFIRDTYNDLFLNGHVAITIYSDQGATNLVIDEHKKIQVLTQSKKFISIMSDYLKKGGYRYYKSNKFRSIEFGFHHWHYRSVMSKNRSELIKYLKEIGFHLWKKE